MSTDSPSKLQAAYDELMNLQPHIAQLPERYRPFIDSHVDVAMALLQEVLSEIRTYIPEKPMKVRQNEARGGPEITPAMIEAGVGRLFDYCTDCLNYERAAKEIFWAMISAMPKMGMAISDTDMKS